MPNYRSNIKEEMTIELDHSPLGDSESMGLEYSLTTWRKNGFWGQPPSGIALIKISSSKQRHV